MKNLLEKVLKELIGVHVNSLQITPKIKNIVVISISFPASDDALIRKKGGTHCRWQHRHQRRIVIGVVVVVAAYTNKQI